MDARIQRRYHNDATFHDLVSRISDAIRAGALTATDMRDAIDAAEDINCQFFAVEGIAKGVFPPKLPDIVGIDFHPDLSAEQRLAEMRKTAPPSMAEIAGE